MCLQPPSSLDRKTSTIWNDDALRSEEEISSRARLLWVNRVGYAARQSLPVYPTPDMACTAQTEA